MRRLVIASLAIFAAPPAFAQIVIYDSNPRIIHVMPQMQSHAHAPPVHSQRAAVAPVAPMTETDEEIIERIERRKQQERRSFFRSAAKPVVKRAEPAPQAELPPPPGPKRALLSAPLPEVGPGSLTPVYPTPRWRNPEPPPQVAAENQE